MRIAFRTDASLDIGSGHVMRCATLGQALTAAGHSVQMICRDLPGHMAARLGAMGFEITLLPAPALPHQSAKGAPPHARWAMVPWDQDAAETRLALSHNTDWLILDHYAFDARWEEAVRGGATRLMVIDDLADRPHACDLILDANAGRASVDYDPLIPMATERLIGPDYALLRPEFGLAREASILRRSAEGYPLRNALITMGGVDLPDATGAILRHLAQMRDQPLRALTVVMGTQAPALDAVRAQAKTMPMPTQVLTDVTDMAALMTEADLAIGAAGGTAWERCALGLPTLLVTLADNQRSGAAALDALGAAIALGETEEASLSQKLTKTVKRLQKPAALRAMSEAAARLVDGLGVGRAVAALERPLHLRAALADDAEAVWNWRESLDATAFAAGPNPPLADHEQWFFRALKDPDRYLWIAQAGIVPKLAGHIRLDRKSPDTADLSIVLAPEARGQGFGARLVTMTLIQARALGFAEVCAEVHAANAASRALFAASGFREQSRLGAMIRLARAP